MPIESPYSLSEILSYPIWQHGINAKYGVYFVFSRNGNLIYIGRSQNLSIRLHYKHEKIAVFQSNPNYSPVIIHFLSLPRFSTARRIERESILRFRPKFNVVFNRKLTPKKKTIAKITITDEKLYTRLMMQKVTCGRDTTLEDVIRWNTSDALICKRQHSETPLVDNLSTKISPQAKK